jgi:hypothetical protein
LGVSSVNGYNRILFIHTEFLSSKSISLHFYLNSNAIGVSLVNNSEGRRTIAVGYSLRSRTLHKRKRWFPPPRREPRIRGRACSVRD